ncbi:MAG TPA: hypothetical protein VEV43_06720 [Actinomycetota bacterium]|nr:hypothetical protein [Actinomycetota bacterium]
MSIGKVAIAALVLCLAVGGGLAALGGRDDGKIVEPIDLDDGARRDDDAAELASVEDDGDDDRTRGDDDRTRGNDGTRGGDNTGDGDATDGDDGTGGGSNTDDVVTYDAPAGTDTGGGTT